MINIIQIRIPKTATTSIEAALKNFRNRNLVSCKAHGHDKTNEILKRYQTVDLSKFVILASIRNPYDRLVSAYQYIIQFKKDKRNKELKYVFDFPSFRDFCLSIDQIYEQNQFFHPQSRWLFSTDKPLFTHLIRYENLLPDWKQFLKSVKLPHLQLPQQRKTKRKGWRKYYDKDMMKRVYHLYEEDFRRLQYNGN